MQRDTQFGEQDENLAYLRGRFACLDMRDELGGQPGDVDEVVAREPLRNARRTHDDAKSRDVHNREIRLIHDALSCSYPIGYMIAKTGSNSASRYRSDTKR